MAVNVLSDGEYVWNGLIYGSHASAVAQTDSAIETR